jgi:hypothetical protein
MFEFIVFLGILASLFIGSLIYLEGISLCIWHKPKKLILADPNNYTKSRTVEYCKHCKRIKYIEE